MDTMLVLLFMVLLVAALLAPLFGTDTSDGRDEGARPPQGWFPLSR